MATWRRAVGRLVPRPIRSQIEFYDMLRFRVAALERRLGLLANAYARDRCPGWTVENDPIPEINRHEFGVHSQNGEDGILFYLFSKIGTTNRRFVEFGIGDGTECNTANLSLNFGWSGLLMDCSEAFIARARAFYARSLRDRTGAVKIVSSLVTRDNIDALLAEHCGQGEVDLLSIDIDGNDYWVWEAISNIDARIVVIEYNAVMGPERAITVEYDPCFDRWRKHSSGLYVGASLAALTKLAHRKGYLLAGCDSHGINAFYVRRDAAEGKVRELTPREAFFPISQQNVAEAHPDAFQDIKDMPFVEV